MTTTSPAAAPSSQRLEWVDFAKGLCIVAVVAMYATERIEDNLHARGWMHHFVDFAQPFRMPDFFLISGLFVSRVIGKPWRSYLDTKVVHFLYFYVLWVTITFGLFEGRQALVLPPNAVAAEYLHLYLQPSGPLWFIYILPLFFLTLRLTRALPFPLVWALAAALKLADLDTGWKLVDRYGMYFVFVLTGYGLAPRIFRVVDWARARPRATAAAFAVWFLLNLLAVRLGLTFKPAVHLLTGLAGAGAVILFSTLLVRASWFGWVRYLGEHSIVVYLSFLIPMAATRRLFVDSGVVRDPGNAVALVVICSVVGSVLLYWSVRSTPLRFLFERPSWARLQPVPVGKAQREV